MRYCGWPNSDFYYKAKTQNQCMLEMDSALNQLCGVNLGKTPRYPLSGTTDVNAAVAWALAKVKKGTPACSCKCLNAVNAFLKKCTNDPCVKPQKTYITLLTTMIPTSCGTTITAGTCKTSPKCPPGKAGAGSTCVTCIANFYTPTAGQTLCSMCPAYSSSKRGSSKCECKNGGKTCATDDCACPRPSPSPSATSGAAGVGASAALAVTTVVLAALM